MKVSSEAALAEAVRDARGPLAIRGGNTRGFAAYGTPLDVSGLNGITLYEPGALTMVARAGTPIAVIEKALAKENQRLAFEPMDHRGLLGVKGEPTIGGVFAANISGPRRIAVGAARDFLLGVRFVDGQGQVIKNGGRVMKNVTGYDLVKLMAGSFGTLGVLTEVAFKVLPRPETQATVLVHGLDAGQAVTVMSRAMGSPFDVSGAAHDPGSGQTAMRVEGFGNSVTYRSAALADLFAGSGAQIETLADQASGKWWDAHRDVANFKGQTGDIWRISCKPSGAPALITKAQANAYLLDWAGGLIWLRCEAGTDVRKRLETFDGHATLIRSTAETQSALGQFHRTSAGITRLTQGLRARFDPRGILNPGMMGGSA